MTPGDWLALASLGLAFAGMASGLIYRMGQLVTSMHELERRVDRIEGKIDRVPKRKAPGGLD